MKIVFFLFTAVILSISITNNTFAVDPDTAWTKTFGGTNIDVAWDVQQTSDGGFVIAGYTRSFGTLSGRNMWLLKTDSSGNFKWLNTYGGNLDDEAYSVQQTSDGGYILTGYTKSSGSGAMDMILLKTDSLGNQLWQRVYGGSSDDEGWSVLQNSDGTYLIAGATSSFGAGGRDVWLIKADNSGNEIWRKTFGGMSSDGARNIQKTMDGGFILTGWTFSYGPGFIGNLWLLKLDSLCNQQWHKYFGGDDADRGYWVKQTPDSGYIITGYTASFGAGLDDMWLIKTNSSGVEEWNKTFGGTGRDYGCSVQISPDGGFIIAGYTLSFGAGSEDLWLVKTNSSGILEWSKTYGGSASDEAFSVRVTSDGGYIATGHTLSRGAGLHDAWLLKITTPVPVELTSFTAIAENNKITLSWQTSSETNNKGFEIERKSDHEWNVIAFVEGSGTTSEMQKYFFTDEELNPGVYSYRLRQIDFDGTSVYSKIVDVQVGKPEAFLVEQNYPNPFNPSTTISYGITDDSFVEIKIFDALGREICTLVNESRQAGLYNSIWNASGVPAGIYFCRIKAGNFTQTIKMVLAK